MKKQDSLLDKYYKGETSIEEEKELKTLVFENEENISEKMVFEYFENEASVPDNLEEDIFSSVVNNQIKKRIIRRKLYSAISAAAVVLIALSVYLDIRSNRKMEMEDNFFVMEQALFQISESIQPPQEQEEMLVLWVDDDVEIILN